MRTSVALVLFNRPDLTEQVFRAVAAARPSRLFLIADGPRPDRPQDAARCAAARAVMRFINESSLRFSADVAHVRTPCVLTGYWQSERYFESCRPAARRVYDRRRPGPPQRGV